MTFDFDTPTVRRNTGSLKWDETDAELPMWVADMDFVTAPAVQESIVKRAERGIFGYATLPDAWADSYIFWWQNRHGLTINRDWLIYTSGVVPAISSMVRRLTQPAENIVVITPVYNIFFNSILNNGRNALESHLTYHDGCYTLDWQDLEEKLANKQTTLLILCNPHNPTGHIWARDELARIGKLCAQYQVTVISDEIHCDITRVGEQYTPFASVDETCRNISATCFAPTKAFNIAGLQTAAVMAADPLLRQRIWRGINNDEVGEPNAFAVDATIAAFTQSGAWLDELREYIDHNFELAYSAIEQFNSKHSERAINICRAQATYLLWIDCSRLSAHSDQLAQYILETQGLYVSAGTQYRGNGERFLRVNLATQSSRVAEGMEKLLQALASYPVA